MAGLIFDDDLEKAIEHEKEGLEWKKQYAMIDCIQEQIEKHEKYIAWFTELQQRRDADKYIRSTLDDLLKEVRV